MNKENHSIIDFRVDYAKRESQKYIKPFRGKYSTLKNNIRELYLQSCKTYEEDLKFEQEHYEYLQRTKAPGLAYLSLTDCGIMGFSVTAKQPYLNYDFIIKAVPKIVKELNIKIAPIHCYTFQGDDGKERICTAHLLPANITERQFINIVKNIVKQSGIKYIRSFTGRYRKDLFDYVNPEQSSEIIIMQSSR